MARKTIESKRNKITIFLILHKHNLHIFFFSPLLSLPLFLYHQRDTKGWNQTPSVRHLINKHDSGSGSDTQGFTQVIFSSFYYYFFYLSFTQSPNFFGIRAEDKGWMDICCLHFINCFTVCKSLFFLKFLITIYYSRNKPLDMTLKKVNTKR